MQREARLEDKWKAHESEHQHRDHRATIYSHYVAMAVTFILSLALQSFQIHSAIFFFSVISGFIAAYFSSILFLFKRDHDDPYNSKESIMNTWRKEVVVENNLEEI